MGKTIPAELNVQGELVMHKSLHVMNELLKRNTYLCGSTMTFADVSAAIEMTQG
jgi:glutathione S-transferase